MANRLREQAPKLGKNGLMPGTLVERGGTLFTVDYDKHGNPVLQETAPAPVEFSAEPTSKHLDALKQELAAIYDEAAENKIGEERTSEAESKTVQEIVRLEEQLASIRRHRDHFQTKGEQLNKRYVEIQNAITAEKERLDWIQSGLIVAAAPATSEVSPPDDDDAAVYKAMHEKGIRRSGDKSNWRRRALGAVAAVAMVAGGGWAYIQQASHDEPQAVGACDISEGSATSFTPAQLTGSVPVLFEQPSTGDPFPVSADNETEIPVVLTAGELSIVQGLCIEDIEAAVEWDGVRATVNLEHATRTAAVSPAQLELNPFDLTEDFDPAAQGLGQEDEAALRRYLDEDTRETIDRRAAEMIAEKALTDPTLQGERAAAQEARLTAAVEEWAAEEGIENVTVAFSGEVGNFSILNGAGDLPVVDGITLEEDKAKVEFIS